MALGDFVAPDGLMTGYDSVFELDLTSGHGERVLAGVLKVSEFGATVDQDRKTETGSGGTVVYAPQVWPDGTTGPLMLADWGQDITEMTPSDADWIMVFKHDILLESTSGSIRHFTFKVGQHIFELTLHEHFSPAYHRFLLRVKTLGGSYVTTLNWWEEEFRLVGGNSYSYYLKHSAASNEYTIGIIGQAVDTGTRRTIGEETAALPTPNFTGGSLLGETLEDPYYEAFGRPRSNVRGLWFGIVGGLPYTEGGGGSSIIHKRRNSDVFYNPNKNLTVSSTSKSSSGRPSGRGGRTGPSSTRTTHRGTRRGRR